MVLATAEQGCYAFFDLTPYLAPDAHQLSVMAPESTAGMVADLFGVLQSDLSSRTEPSHMCLAIAIPAFAPTWWTVAAERAGSSRADAQNRPGGQDGWGTSVTRV